MYLLKHRLYNRVIINADLGDESKSGCSEGFTNLAAHDDGDLS